MNKKMYRFTCKKCKHEYTESVDKYKCPKCETMNQTNGKYNPTR